MAANGNSGYTAAQFTTNCKWLPESLRCKHQWNNGWSSLIPFNTDITGLISPREISTITNLLSLQGGSITLTLTTLPADYDLKLLNSAGTQVSISQNGSTTSETINYTAQQVLIMHRYILTEMRITRPIAIH